MNILFMCVANSARSQMAEGLAKKILGGKARIESAGSEPKTVHPHALSAMREIGIDLSKHYSKSVEQLPPEFTANLEYVITLCAEEVCPMVVARNAKRLHWPLPDPAGRAGSDAEQLERFRKVRDQLKEKLELLAREIESMPR